MSDIDAIVFDVGGVLSAPPFEQLEAYGASIGLPAGALSAYFVDDPHFTKVETGAGDLRSFFLGLPDRSLADHDVKVSVRSIVTALEQARPIRPEMVQLARELRSHYVVGVLTNNVRENDDFLAESLPAEVFDPIVNSGLIGFRKPDPRAYAYLLDRLGLPGSRVVYIDDFAVNLPPAQDLGMRTILCTSPGQVRADLVELGARLAPPPS